MLRRIASSLCAVLVLATAARATWSIVVVNQRTGEVCVASATCLSSFDLKRALCVLRVGEGGAAAQSVVDTTGANRQLVWNELANGTPPDQILQLLAQQDTQHQRRQYGIVSLSGGAATFTGTLAGQARHGVTGQSGDLVYAIQGNLLTGAAVVTAAEAAFLSATGDLPARVMTAMVAAQALGGDGRCSCHPSLPTSCGVPPPAFTLSSATAFLVVARLGDTNGTCDGTVGCANGSYWCDLREMSTTFGDPVLRIANTLLPLWRDSIAEYADQLLTQVRPGATAIPADGIAAVDVEVEFRDSRGMPVDTTFFSGDLLVEALDPGVSVAVAGPVASLGAGRYRFTLTSTGNVGLGRWRLHADYPGDRRIRLWPDLELRADPVTPLHCGVDAIGASTGGTAPLTLNAGAASAGAPYLVLGSSSGTAPGITFGQQHLPLNRDRFLMHSFHQAGSAAFPATSGVLDANGRALAAFAAAPGHLSALVGRRIDWAAIVRGPAAFVTNVAGFDVAP